METEEKEINYSVRVSNQQAFDKRLIAHIVSLVEQGVPRETLIKEYGMSKCTLGEWLKKHGATTFRKTYSLSHKRSVVRAVEAGMSLQQAAIAYNVSSYRVIKRWIATFHAENAELSISNPIEMAKKPENNAQSAALKAMQKELEQAKLQIKALDTLIDIAEEQLKIDIRKKSGAKQS